MIYGGASPAKPSPALGVSRLGMTISARPGLYVLLAKPVAVVHAAVIELVLIAVEVAVTVDV